MLAQIDLINPNQKPQPSPMEIFGRAFGQEVAIGQIIASYGPNLDKVVPAEILADAVKSLQAKPLPLSNKA
jgi:hypothetical protein